MLDKALALGRSAWRRSVLPESVALAAVCTADMVSTLYLVRHHLAVEANPLFVGPLERSDAAFLVLKGLSYAVPIVVLESLRSVRPEAVVRALRACLVGYLVLYVLGVLGTSLIR